MKRGSIVQWLLSFLVICSVVNTVCCSPSRNPYSILGVENSATQSEIRKRYRALCLQFHPDKNVHRSVEDRKKCETTFKMIQEANSMIGDEDSRKKFDRMSSSPFASFQQQRSGGHSSTFGNDPMAEALFRSFSSGGAGGLHFQRGFSSRSFEARPPASGAFADSFQRMGLGTFKSIFIQKVKISLEDLYKGTKGVEFKVRNNIWTRNRAAMRGGAIYINLYQSLIYMFPLLRVHRYVALVAAVTIFHATLPKPKVNVYQIDLQRGYKGGKTRLKFASQSYNEPEIIFDIEELPHPRYKRVADDLHTTVTISTKDAQVGCVVEIDSLDPDEPPTTIKLRPHQIRSSGEEVRVPGKGWPIRNKRAVSEDKSTMDFGDLIVQFKVKKRV